MAEKMEAAKWHEIVQACFFTGVDLCARHMGHSINDKLKGYSIWAANVTEVEIDVLTGERNILRSDLIEDTGVTINPEVDIGQIEGAFVFGLGFWTTEQIKHDPVTGQLLTADTWVILFKSIDIHFVNLWLFCCRITKFPHAMTFHKC